MLTPQFSGSSIILIDSVKQVSSSMVVFNQKQAAPTPTEFAFQLHPLTKALAPLMWCMRSLARPHNVSYTFRMTEVVAHICLLYPPGFCISLERSLVAL